MRETRKYYPTRTLIKLSSLLPKFGQGNYLICIDDGVLQVIRKLLERGYWPTTYYHELKDQYYELPTEEELDTIKHYLSIFLEETSDMSFCDDLLTTLQQQTEALTNALSVSGLGGCAKGSSTSGNTSEPVSTFVDDGAEVPDGFEGVEEYKGYKCKASNLIAEILETDMTILKALGIVELTAAGLALALLTPIPFDELIAFAAVLVGLLLSALLTTMANEIINALQSDKEGFVCALYTADTVGEARSAVGEWQTEQEMSVQATYVMNYMLSTDNLNRLFGYNVQLDNQNPSTPIDCDDCDAPTYVWTCFSMTFGSNLVEHEDGSKEWDSAFVGGGLYRTNAETGPTIGSECEDGVTIHDIQLTDGEWGDASTNAFIFYGPSGEIYNSDTPPTYPFEGVTAIILSSEAGHTVRIWASDPE